ncbi:MAG TPA: nucleotidyltransferase domain-containing protein [Bdellovibrionota bacterium]|nr:nucleotidyltransferase domain-containing protein [Bdellovibrionota bacterium]
MGKPQTVEEIRDALKPLWESGKFEMVMLFGSVATGRMSSGSDLDIALWPRNGWDEISVTTDIVRQTHWSNVDVVDLRRADPVVAMQIARTGALLYSDNPAFFTEFKSLAFRRFVDTEKLRKAQRRALDKFEKGE